MSFELGAFQRVAGLENLLSSGNSGEFPGRYFRMVP